MIATETGRKIMDRETLEAVGGTVGFFFIVFGCVLSVMRVFGWINLGF